jgi:hypothetical protein
MLRVGVINTWNGISQRKMRLRVVPKIAVSVSHSGRQMDEMGCILLFLPQHWSDGQL